MFRQVGREAHPTAPEGGRAPRDHARKARHLEFRLQLARPRQPPSKLVPSSATNSARLPPLAHGSQLIIEWPWLCWQNGDRPVSLRCARRWNEVRMSEVLGRLRNPATRRGRKQTNSLFWACEKVSISRKTSVEKNCPPRAVPKQFPFPNDRVDDRTPSNQTSNEGLSSRRAPSLRDFI